MCAGSAVWSCGLFIQKLVVSYIVGLGKVVSTLAMPSLVEKRQSSKDCDQTDGPADSSV